MVKIGKWTMAVWITMYMYIKLDGNYYGFDYNGYMYQDCEFTGETQGEGRWNYRMVRIAKATGIIMMKLLQ